MYRMSNNPTYRLRVGDTLSAVARRHGFKITDLTALNPRINPHMSRPGALVKLPSLNTAVTATPAAMAAPIPDIPAPVYEAVISDGPAPIDMIAMADELTPIEAATMVDDPVAIEAAAMADDPAQVEVASALDESIADTPPALLVGNFLPASGRAPIDPLEI